MTTRREFLTRSFAAVAGAGLVAAGFGTPAVADHKNTGVPQSRTHDKAKDGSGGGTPDGHAHNHGETSLRTEGAPVLGGTPRNYEDRRQHTGEHDGDCPHGTGDCPDGTHECDGSGPDD